MRPPAGFTTRTPVHWGRLLLGAGLIVSMLFAWIGATDNRVSARANHFFLDYFAEHSASGQTAQRTIVVDIDDVSLAAVGQWPWPRYRIGMLVEQIAAIGPSAIGIDVLFSEPDRTSLNNVRNAYRRDFGVDIRFDGVPERLTDNDGYLGSVLAKTNAVAARYFYFDHVSSAQAAPAPQFRFTGDTHLLSLHEAPGVLDNVSDIASQVKYAGFLNSQPDADGIFRRIPLLIRHGGNIYPHLALASFMRSLGEDTAHIEHDANGALIRIGAYHIPISDKGLALLRFNGEPRLYPAVSAIDVLQQAPAAGALKDKLVFVGSSAAALNDLHSTIFDAQFPGIKAQAVIAENIGEGNFIREPSWTAAAIVLACLMTGLSITALFMFLREPLQICLSTAAVAVALFAVSAGLFQWASIFVSPAFPLAVTAVLFALFTTARFALEKRQAYVWFKQLANAQQVTMESMAAVAETRDPETGAHIKRTQHYVKAIAEQLRRSGHYTQVLTPAYIDLLFASAPLHDIGKVGVPDHILMKPGRLTDDEFVIMKKHAQYGRDIIHSAAQRIEGENFLILAGEIALNHHEKWDGTGYPRGLAGQDIPLAGRIMAVADVYDALISRRCYKAPFAHSEAVRYMRNKRNVIFDPVVIDAFFDIEDRILEIAAKYRDEAEMVYGDR